MIASIRARMQGKTSRAYPSRRKVANLLTDGARRVHATRAPLHADAAARLDEIAAYQPGLIDLHAELTETEIYLQALVTQARRDGHTALARALEVAASTIAGATSQVAIAATKTTPQP